MKKQPTTRWTAHLSTPVARRIDATCRVIGISRAEMLAALWADSGTKTTERLIDQIQKEANSLREGGVFE